MTKVFNPANLQKLESEERYKALPPMEVLCKLNIQASSIVADIGCGTGYFTLPLSKICAKGEVFAFDIEKKMINYLDERRKANKLVNIHTGIMQPDAIPLSDNITDITFTSFVLHEAPDFEKYALELLRITKPGGKVIVLEWQVKESPFGPPLDHRLKSEFVKKLFVNDAESVEIISIGEWFYGVIAVK